MTIAVDWYVKQQNKQTKSWYVRPPDNSVQLKLLFFNHNICCGSSKELSQLDKIYVKTITKLYTKIAYLDFGYMSLNATNPTV